MQLSKLPDLALARHGETVLNDEGRWSGRLETPLTPRGCIQAYEIARLISNVGVEVVFTSTSERTRTTWAIIQSTLGISQVDIHQSDGLLERDIGDFAGLTYPEIQAKYKLSQDELEKIRLDYTTRSPGGESRKDVHERVLAVYHEMILPQLSKKRNVVVIGHNISISALMLSAEQAHPSKMHELQIERAQALKYTVDPSSKRPVNKILLQ